MNRKNREGGTCQQLQTCCMGLLLSQNLVQYEPSVPAFSPKEVVQVDCLDLVSGTYRAGQMCPWLQESMRKEALSFLHCPKQGHLLQNSGPSMHPVLHQTQCRFQVLSLRT